MKLPKPEDITVSVSSLGGNQAAASWNATDARYHIWLNVEDGRIRGPIYKNPLKGAANQFRTRQLQPTSPSNAATVAFVQKTVRERGLIAKATQDMTEAKDRETAVRLAHDAQVVRGALQLEAATLDNRDLSLAMLAVAQAPDEVLRSLRRAIFRDGR